jgi:hypothetical protein
LPFYREIKKKFLFLNGYGFWGQDSIELWQNHLGSFVLFLEKALEYFNRVFEQKKYSIIINVP